MRILVCGGRDYADYNRLRDVLDGLAKQHSLHYRPDGNWLPTDIMIISGAAKGADSLAVEWAVVNYAHFEEYHADWQKHGRAAGPIRNQRMIDEGNPDLVVAFPGGIGTSDMVRRAQKVGIPVIKVGAS